MNVLIITQELDPNSSNMRVAHDWAAAIAARCQHVTVLAARARRHDLPANVTVVPLRRSETDSRPLVLARLLWHLFRLFSRGRVDVVFAHNPDYAEGLSTSLRAGLGKLDAAVDGALVCLGDMPQVGAEQLDALIAAFDPVEGRSICVPVVGGKRGNPVLWGAEFFAQMGGVAGDVGARHLIGENAEVLCEVPADGDGVLSPDEARAMMQDQMRRFSPRKSAKP